MSVIVLMVLSGSPNDFDRRQWGETPMRGGSPPVTQLAEETRKAATAAGCLGRNKSHDDT